MVSALGWRPCDRIHRRLAVGIAVAALAAWSGLDRGRSFYPTVLIVIASYYALFAVMGQSTRALVLETAVGVAFVAIAIFGFKRNMWVVAAGIAGHGVFDLTLHGLIDNPGMPVYWPGFCASIDVVLGAWMALQLWRDPELHHSAP